MPPHHPTLPKAPLPTKIFFDPYNSSSTGHQRAENRLSGSTSWRDSRSFKLSHQFRDSNGGGGKEHLSDLVGAGSKDYGKDGRKENGDWEVGAPGLREPGWQDIRQLMGGGKKRKSSADGVEGVSRSKRQKSEEYTKDNNSSSPPLPSGDTSTIPPLQTQKHPQIFRGLTFYLNGSTAPLVSDHRLKQLFAQHGGNTSIMLGRRTTTHVIIGEDCGGGLASTKINKEVANVRGKGIKFVTAKWVLDSVERGIRQPEGRYVPRNLAGRVGGAGQGSVRTFFNKPVV